MKRPPWRPVWMTKFFSVTFLMASGTKCQEEERKPRQTKVMRCTWDSNGLRARKTSLGSQGYVSLSLLHNYSNGWYINTEYSFCLVGRLDCTPFIKLKVRLWKCQNLHIVPVGLFIAYTITIIVWVQTDWWQTHCKVLALYKCAPYMVNLAIMPSL